MYIIDAMITCLIFYPIALLYTIYKKRALEIIFFALIILFGAGVSFLAFSEYGSTATLVDCLFLGYSISWIPFAILYGPVRISFEDSNFIKATIMSGNNDDILSKRSENGDAFKIFFQAILADYETKIIDRDQMIFAIKHAFVLIENGDTVAAVDWMKEGRKYIRTL